MDQADPWQVVPRQVFTPYDCLLISVAFVVLCRGGYLWVTCVLFCFLLPAGETIINSIKSGYSPTCIKQAP